MKKLLFLIIIVALVSVPSSSFGAPSSGHTGTPYQVSTHCRTLTWALTADSTDGSFQNTVTNTANTTFITGWSLYRVTAYSPAGGTDPDAADVLIKDSNGEYILGSEDGGTTAYQGLNLIHATLTYSCIPDLYLPRAGDHYPYYPVVTGALTIIIKNQATHSASVNIVLTFVK